MDMATVTLPYPMLSLAIIIANYKQRVRARRDSVTEARTMKEAVRWKCAPGWWIQASYNGPPLVPLLNKEARGYEGETLWRRGKQER
jgi:hypothetical protein